jgi:hypothetical protein
VADGAIAAAATEPMSDSVAAAALLKLVMVGFLKKKWAVVVGVKKRAGMGSLLYESVQTPMDGCGKERRCDKLDAGLA